MKSFYIPPLTIHQAFLKRIDKIRQDCGVEAANLFLAEAKKVKEKLSLVATEADLESAIKELALVNTIVFPYEYIENSCSCSDNLFYEMPLCCAENKNYYGRIMICFPYHFKKNNTIDDLKVFCEEIDKKLGNINSVEIYRATYRG